MINKGGLLWPGIQTTMYGLNQNSEKPLRHTKLWARTFKVLGPIGNKNARLIQLGAAAALSWTGDVIEKKK